MKNTPPPGVGAPRPVEVHHAVRILSVESCASGLPEVDQAKLRSLIGAWRSVAEIDRYGFIWLSFDEGVLRSDFCLKSTEVEVA